VLANQDGDRQIPSVISFKEDQQFHGVEARTQLIRNASNTIANFRDLLSTSYARTDPTSSHNSAHVLEKDGFPIFRISTAREGAEESEEMDVSVSKAVQIHLGRLKDSAEDFLGRPVTGAVLTVPTDFSEKQQQALREAAMLARLNVVQVIHEPIAAILAYSTLEHSEENDNILVADFGGLRSDVAVVSSRGGLYTMLATSHDLELGGAQLDDALAEFFAKEFQKKNKVDMRTNARAMTKLRLEAESAKKTLSTSTTATTGVDSLDHGIDFHFAVNRLRFEMVTKKYVDQMLHLVEQVVKKANLDVLQISKVILSGGQSHMPKLASRVAALFPETTQILSPAFLLTAIDPSELCARGAALQGSIIPKSDKTEIEHSIHPVVTSAPHLSKAIGYMRPDGTLNMLMDANTPLPARKSSVFSAPPEGGNVVIRIAEGREEIITSTPQKLTNGTDHKAEKEDSDTESDEDEDEPAEIRELRLGVENVLGEFVMKDVKPKAKLELTITIDADLNSNFTLREVGGSGGIRGQIGGVDVDT